MENPQQQSIKTLQKFIGYLGGFWFTVIMLVGGGLGGYKLKTSLSAYNYSNMDSAFAGLLFCIATFLFIYKGYDNKRVFWGFINDTRLTNLCAVFAICVALFPCDEVNLLPYTTLNSNVDCIKVETTTIVSYQQNSKPDSCCSATPTTSTTIINPQNVVKTVCNTIHFSAAVLLLVSLGFMSFYFFTMTDKLVFGRMKYIRNKIYISCGIFIWATIVFGSLIGLVIDYFYIKNYTILIIEIITLAAFGYSWLVKAGEFYQDEDDPNDRRFYFLKSSKDIKIYDNKGEELKIVPSKNQYDLSTQPAGTYLFKGMIDNQIVEQEIII